MLEGILFYFFSILAVSSALAVISFRNPIYSTLSLLTTMFSLAVLFLIQQATFVALIHLVVYAGAIIILFLFVIMLIGIHQPEEIKMGSLLRTVILFLSLGLVFLIGKTLFSYASLIQQKTEPLMGSVYSLGKLLFTQYLLPFELLSLLLFIAIIGAVYLGKDAA